MLVGWVSFLLADIGLPSGWWAGHLWHNFVLWSYQYLDFPSPLYVHLSGGGAIGLKILPHVVILYLTALAVRTYRCRHLVVDPTTGNSQLVTEETILNTRHLDFQRPSPLPMMDASRAPTSLPFFREDYRKPRELLNTQAHSVLNSSRYSSSPATPSIDANPRRLSKRSPLIDYVWVLVWYAKYRTASCCSHLLRTHYNSPLPLVNFTHTILLSPVDMPQTLGSSWPSAS